MVQIEGEEIRNKGKTRLKRRENKRVGGDDEEVWGR